MTASPSSDRARNNDRTAIAPTALKAALIMCVPIAASIVTFAATHAISRTQTSQVGGAPTSIVRYPTMLDMTFPEFEAAVQKTDSVLLPIGAIEEHSSHLPLGADAMNATAQTFEVQAYLRRAGFDTILGPPLNIGITNEGGDWTRDGTYAYPGSLTVRRDTFVALYVDVLRSLHDNGLRRAFLYLGHLGTRHVEAALVHGSGPSGCGRPLEPLGCRRPAAA